MLLILISLVDRDELGQSIEQTFDQIVQAINTGNGRALIQLGVLPENFKRSADSAELLANKGKLLKTVLDQLGTSADRLGKYGDTAFDKFQQLENAFSDLKTAAGEGLVPALIPVVEILTEIIKGATKATNAIATLFNLKESKNKYLAYSKDDLEKIRDELLKDVSNAKFNAKTYRFYGDEKKASDYDVCRAEYRSNTRKDSFISCKEQSERGNIEKDESKNCFFRACDSSQQ